jgi:outer membrane lipoprotein-sorting protein
MLQLKLSSKLKTTLIAVMVSAVLSPSVLAESSHEKGYAIAKERKNRDAGWQSSTQTMTMILRNPQGEESVREMRGKSLEVHGDGDKGLTIFDQPRDVKGTAFLTFSHIKGSDDQWLYLPALKRVKRISSRNKSGPFMGSEFAYEDMSSFEVEKYSFNYLKDEACPGQASLNCFVVESIPTDKYSGYTRQIAWIDQQEYRVFKVEFYDVKKALLKTMLVSDYKQYLGKYWRAHMTLMTNHQTNKSTVLKLKDIQFNVNLSDKDFNKKGLQRLR